MGPIQRALGMGSTIEFRGQEYKISPWTYQIQGEFERFMEKRAWEAVRRAAAHMQPDEAREARAALTADIAAGEYSFGSGTVAKACANLPTLEHLIFLLRSEEHTSELQSQSNLVCR